MGMTCLADTAEQTLTVGIATTPREKREVYRLRYNVYVQELGMDVGGVDHRNKLLFDDMDKWGVLLYVRAGSEIVATKRLNIGPIDKFPRDLARMLSLDRFQKFHDAIDTKNFSYTSKLMVSPNYRNSMALHMLMAKAYDVCCSERVQFSFGICNFHLLRLYEQYGLRRSGRGFTAPGFDGVVMPVVLLLDDVEHLRAVRSPLYRQARKRGVAGDRVAEWFAGEFSEQASIINSQLISQDDLWAVLTKQLRRAPNLVMPLLNGLSGAEARQFLHECGIVMQCRPGDYIALRGFSSHTLGILIGGRLRTLGPAGLGATTLRPGQCFGPSGLVEQPRYGEDVFAVSEAKILLLSRLSFQRFQHTHPEVAARVLDNYAELTGDRRREAYASKQQTAK